MSCCLNSGSGTIPACSREFAQAAEALGFSHLIAYDHVLGAEHDRRDPPLSGPYTEADPFHEVMTLYAWWAAVTQQIELVAGVLVLPQRQTALVAKQAVEIDLLSGGRLRLGLGTGWNYVEYESLGVDFRDRGKRLEEQVMVLRRLWTEPVVDVTGRFHRIDRAGLRPLPVPADPGLVRRLQRCRAATAAPASATGSSGAGGRQLPTQSIGQVRAGAAEVGRDPDTIGFEAILGDEAGAWSDDVSSAGRRRGARTPRSSLPARGPG